MGNSTSIDDKDSIILIGSNKYKYKCQKCQFHMESADIEEHIKIHRLHLSDPNLREIFYVEHNLFRCKRCNGTFRLEHANDHLNFHINCPEHYTVYSEYDDNHESVAFYRCARFKMSYQCDRICHPDEIKQHDYEHELYATGCYPLHGEHEGTYKCMHCDTIMTREESINYMQQSHEIPQDMFTVDDKFVNCNMCSLKTSKHCIVHSPAKYADLLEHAEKHRHCPDGFKFATSYTCNLCCTSFDASNHDDPVFECHRENHKKCPDGFRCSRDKFVCELCVNSEFTLDETRIHQKLHDERPTGFSCVGIIGYKCLSECTVDGKKSGRVEIFDVEHAIKHNETHLKHTDRYQYNGGNVYQCRTCDNYVECNRYRQHDRMHLLVDTFCCRVIGTIGYRCMYSGNSIILPVCRAPMTTEEAVIHALWHLHSIGFTSVQYGFECQVCQTHISFSDKQYDKIMEHRLQHEYEPCFENHGCSWCGKRTQNFIEFTRHLTMTDCQKEWFILRCAHQYMSFENFITGYLQENSPVHYLTPDVLQSIAMYVFG